MRHSIVWLAVVAAASLVAFAAVNGLRTMPPGSAPQGDRTVAMSSAPPRRTAPAKIDAKGDIPQPPLGFDIVTAGPQGRVVIAGRAAAGDRVRVMADGKLLGEATADARGEWVLLPTAPVAPGRRVLSLEAIGRAGGPMHRSPETVKLTVLPGGASLASAESGADPTRASGAAGGHTWLVRRGNTLWLIARDLYGAGPRYTAIYAANRRQVRDPDLIYPGQQMPVPGR